MDCSVSLEPGLRKQADVEGKAHIHGQVNLPLEG